MKKKSYNLDQALRRVERLETAVQSSHRTLKAIAENFGNADYRDRLRQAVNDSDLYETAVAGI